MGLVVLCFDFLACVMELQHPLFVYKLPFCGDNSMMARNGDNLNWKSSRLQRSLVTGFEFNDVLVN